MSARSGYLNEEAGLLVCYGKQYDESDEDCEECPLSGDCETLTELRRQQRRPARVAKIPAVKPRPKPREEEQEDDWHVPWAVPDDPDVPPSWHAPAPNRPIPQYAHPQYMVPVPPTPMQTYMQPGMHSSAQVIPHPAPHLTYMISNPVDCPMPIVDERWWIRVAKNVASAALSEGGRQFYEFFRRFRF